MQQTGHGLVVGTVDKHAYDACANADTKQHAHSTPANALGQASSPQISPAIPSPLKL